MDISVRVAGEAGQGIETIGGLLTRAFASMGLYVFTTETYMSRIRGGLNWMDIRIADHELWSARERPNLLVVLAPKGLDFLRAGLGMCDMVLYNGEPRPGVIAMDFSAIAKELTGAAVMANAVAAGAVMALLGYDPETLRPHLERQFGRKGAEVVEGNMRCARRGAERSEPYLGGLLAPRPAGAPETVYSGADAVALGAATAGVKLVTSYPMTPSTGVFTALARMADEYGILVEQAEDEIAAINMVCGATYAGVPAMTTTSGGGFALMVEGMALAGMLELPAFVMLGQRPGPATGLPTRTGQSELRFALHAGHGEFAKAVFAPGAPEQAYRLTRRALEIAHRFQTPVILLTDQFLADMRRNGLPLDATPRHINRHVLLDPPAGYLRYQVTPSGVSPRALPGSAAYVVVDSDEHTEDGHITEDLEARVRLQDKRMRKLDGMVAEAGPPEWYGLRPAEHLLVCWGSTYGPCREAVDLLAAEGRGAAMLHFAQVWPLDAAAVRAMLAEGGVRRVTVVEGNATGQFGSVLREVGVLGGYELVTRYDGLPFTGEEIARRVG